MRVLELDNKYSPRFLIDENIEYFTVRWKESRLVQCFSISDNTIKFKDRNKTKIVYKDAKFTFSSNIIYISVVYNAQNNFSNKTLNWIGVYDEKFNTFYKNPLYTGSIDVNEIIAKLQGK